MDTGVYRWGQLAASAPRVEIDRAIADGRLRKLRRDWYAVPTANCDVVAAVSSGGVLSCLSALSLHGVWTPPTDRLHVRGNDATSRLHPEWCRQVGRQPPEAEAVDDLATALRHAAKCLDEEGFVVVCDSVMNRRLMDQTDLEALFRRAPRYVSDRLAKCDRAAESGTESMVRLRLGCRPGLRIRTQVQIDGVGRVDMVVGESLIIEVDGYEYHSDPDAFERDRLRDLRAKALGYNVIRLTFKQVVYQWQTVAPLLLELIKRREHLRPLPLPSRTATTF